MNRRVVAVAGMAGAAGEHADGGGAGRGCSLVHWFLELAEFVALVGVRAQPAVLRDLHCQGSQVHRHQPLLRSPEMLTNRGDGICLVQIADGAEPQRDVGFAHGSPITGGDDGEYVDHIGAIHASAFRADSGEFLRAWTAATRSSVVDGRGRAEEVPTRLP